MEHRGYDRPIFSFARCPQALLRLHRFRNGLRRLGLTSLTQVINSLVLFSSRFSFGQLKALALKEILGQLVALGFDVTVFTPAPYQRHRL